MTENSGAMIAYEGIDGPIQAYLALPQPAGEPRPAVIVIHEIFGLDDHIRDVTDRFAAQGYVALAPHLYSRADLAGVLTPPNVQAAVQFQMTLPREKITDRDFVRQEIDRLPAGEREKVQVAHPVLFGGLPREKLVQELVRAVDYLSAQSYVQSGKIGSVGFCFGGGMSIALACRAKLAACVVFYGDNPNPIDLVQNIAGPVMGLYGAEDMRINSHLDELVRAMATYKKDFEMKIYPGAGHAFFNDTRPIYREAAAKDAWERVMRFYSKTLDE